MRDVFSDLALDFGEGHPLHRALHLDPGLRRRAARIAGIARRIEPQVDRRDWMAFCDQRARLHADEIEIAFRTGFESGALATQVERLSNAAPRGSQEALLTRDVRALLLGTSLSADRAAGILLALALGLLRSKRVATSKA